MQVKGVVEQPFGGLAGFGMRIGCGLQGSLEPSPHRIETCPDRQNTGTVRRIAMKFRQFQSRQFERRRFQGRLQAGGVGRFHDMK